LRTASGGIFGPRPAIFSSGVAGSNAAPTTASCTIIGPALIRFLRALVRRCVWRRNWAARSAKIAFAAEHVSLTHRRNREVRVPVDICSERKTVYRLCTNPPWSGPWGDARLTTYSKRSEFFRPSRRSRRLGGRWTGSLRKYRVDREGRPTRTGRARHGPQLTFTRAGRTIPCRGRERGRLEPRRRSHV